MAIFGTLAVARQQTNNPRLVKAIDFLMANNLQTVFNEVSTENKKTIEIEGDTIFAIFQEYTSKPLDGLKPEGHKKYIDIQYIFDGEETILLASTADITMPDNYDPVKDIYFPEVAACSQIRMRKNDAAILFPEDLHGPCGCVDKPCTVRKVVVKVALG